MSMYTKEEIGRVVEAAWLNLFLAAGFRAMLSTDNGYLDVVKGIDLIISVEGSIKTYQIKCNPVDALKHLQDGVYKFDRMVPVIVGAPDPSRTDAHEVLRQLELHNVVKGNPVSEWNYVKHQAYSECEKLAGDNPAWHPTKTQLLAMLKREEEWVPVERGG